MIDRVQPNVTMDPLDLRYPGSKGLAGLYQWICARLPAHVFYAEPFAGKGAIFRHKPPALRTWLIDRDPDVVTWWHRQSRPGFLENPRNIVDADESGRSHVRILQGCGIRWLELAAEWAPPDLLIYVDPPYLPETRVRKNLYRHELTAADHVRLLRAVLKLRCPVLVSGYMSDLYARALDGWTLETREVITRGGTMRTECLWSNAARASSSIAMDYQLLGADFRERQRVSRKVKRWTADFRRLPARERAALLLALLDAERTARRRHRQL